MWTLTFHSNKGLSEVGLSIRGKCNVHLLPTKHSWKSLFYEKFSHFLSLRVHPHMFYFIVKKREGVDPLTFLNYSFMDDVFFCHHMLDGSGNDKLVTFYNWKHHLKVWHQIRWGTTLPLLIFFSFQHSNVRFLTTIIMTNLDYYQLIWFWHIQRKFSKDIKVLFQQTIMNILIPFHLFHVFK